MNDTDSVVVAILVSVLLGGALFGGLVGAKMTAAAEQQAQGICEDYCAPAQLWRIKDGECLCPDKTLKLQRKTYNN